MIIFKQQVEFNVTLVGTGGAQLQIKNQMFGEATRIPKNAYYVHFMFKIRILNFYKFIKKKNHFERAS